MEIDKGIVAAVIGGAATIGALLTRLLYRAIGHRLDQVEKLARDTDDRRRADVIELHQKLDAHATRDADMHDKIMEKLSAIPTRDEVERIVARSGS